MLRVMAAALIILWMLGLVAGLAADPFIHVLYAVAVVLLVVSINREVRINRKLRHMLRNRGGKKANTGNIGL